LKSFKSMCVLPYGLKRAALLAADICRGRWRPPQMRRQHASLKFWREHFFLTKWFFFSPPRHSLRALTPRSNKKTTRKESLKFKGALGGNRSRGGKKGGPRDSLLLKFAKFKTCSGRALCGFVLYVRSRSNMV
jgi:hypothetical protein